MKERKAVLTPRPEAPTRRLWISVFLVGLLSACASAPPATPEEQIRQRAQERWQALIKGDFERAYTYLSPASRAVVPYERYRGSIGGAVVWKGAEVVDVRCETLEKCIAKVKVLTEPVIFRQRFGTIETHLDETWLLDKGQWWFLFKL